VTARGVVAVTGAGGFLGRALLPPLLGAGYDVRALVRAVPADAIPAVDWRATGDFVHVDDAQFRDALAGAATIVHLAAQAHRPHVDAPEANATLHAINAQFPVRLARAAAAAGVRHFVFASSVKVHGDTSPPGHPLRESAPFAPADAYGASKVAAEEGLARVAQETGLRVTALRLPLVYGPGAKANFAALIRAVRKRAVLPVGSIANRRSLLATGNLASALLALLEDDGRRETGAGDDVTGPRAASGSAIAVTRDPGDCITPEDAGAPAIAMRPDEAGRLTPYLLADAQAVSTPDLVRALATALGVAPRIVPFPPALLRVATSLPVAGERIARLVDSLEIDAAAFRTRFAWTPPVSLAAGLAAAVREAPPL